MASNSSVIRKGAAQQQVIVDRRKHHRDEKSRSSSRSLALQAARAKVACKRRLHVGPLNALHRWQFGELVTLAQDEEADAHAVGLAELADQRHGISLER